MNRLVCELLKLGLHKRKNDNSEYYSVTVLIENRVSVMFFKSKELYDGLNKVERLSGVCLLGKFYPKDDTSFTFQPEGFEV